MKAVFSVALLVATLFAATPALAAQVTGYVDRGVMADGNYTHPGAAACPPSFPFGTVLDVTGVGPVVCEDHYASYLGFRFDLWVPTVAQAFALTGQYDYSILRWGW